jgi:hypothetical protein
VALLVDLAVERWRPAALGLPGWVEILDLIEPRLAPDAVSTYRDDEERAWSRRWPSECIWRLRRA